MKNVILAIVGILIGMSVFSIAFSTISYENRKNALEKQVSKVVENVLEEEYPNGDEEEAERRLVEELTLDVGSNGSVAVKVRKLDLKKGIVSVVVTETFHQFNGKRKTIVCEKTAIVEKMLLEEPKVTVTFLVEGQFYKEYQIVEGEKCPMPKVPDPDFKGWLEQGNNQAFCVETIGQVWEDKVYEAVME